MQTGMIAMYPLAVAPEGWVICDGRAHGSAALEALIGSPNTPDLRNKMIRGAGATPLNTVGGADTVTMTAAQMPTHNHGGLTGTEAAHTHTGTSSAMSRNATHSHTGATYEVTADHVHGDPDRNTDGDSANHTHRVTLYEGIGEGADGGYLDSNPSADAGQTFDGGAANNTSINHVHRVPASGDRTSGWASVDHTHTITMDAPNLDHTHGFSLATPVLGHSHTVPNAGSGTAFSVVPKHAAMYFVIKL